VVNALHLGEAELDALRSLQAGPSTLDAFDPICQELSAAGLVQLRGTVFRYWSLTMRGRLYKTD
jgi:hypothetical protein